MSDFIKFKEIGTSKSGKTIVTEVRSKHNIYLGVITWYGPWRKYCFSPANTCVFDSFCVEAIKNYMDVLNEEHKRQNRSKG